MFRTFLTVAVWFVVNSPASANGFVSGNKLYEYCRASDGTYESIACFNYIIGAADVFLGASQFNEAVFGWRVCPPGGLTQGQIEDIVVRWLRENPSDRHYSAVSAVGEALATSFPCR